MQLSEDAIDERLESWPVTRLASRADDGRPDQVPIVFARSGGRPWSPVDGKSKRSGELVRVRNLSAHPEVSAAIAALEAKYPQYATVPVLRADPTLIAFEPGRIVSWMAAS